MGGCDSRGEIVSDVVDLTETATQTAFSRLVGVSQQAISDKVHAGVLKDGGTLGDWLLAYCERLRIEASGRSGEESQSLTRARTDEARASAELKQLMIREKSGLLVPTVDIEPRLFAMVTAARTELLSLPDKLTSEIRALHGIEVDPQLFEDRIYESLNHLATGLYANSDTDDAPGGESVGAAA